MGNNYGTSNNNKKYSKNKKNLSDLSNVLNNPENLMKFVTEIEKNILIKNMSNSINIGYNHLNLLIKNNSNENNESLINNHYLIENELKYTQIIDDSIDNKLLGKLHYKFQNLPSQNTINNLIDINNNKIIKNNVFNISSNTNSNNKNNSRIENSQRDDELNITSFSTAIGCKASSSINKIKTFKIGKKDDVLLYPNSENNMLNSNSKKDSNPSIESSNTLGTFISSMNNSNNQINNNNIIYNNGRKINNKKIINEEKKKNKLKFIIPQLDLPKRSQSPKEILSNFNIYKNDNIDNSNLSERNTKVKINSDIIDNNKKDYLINCINKFAKEYPLNKNENNSPIKKIKTNSLTSNTINNNINSPKNQDNINKKSRLITNKKIINNTNSKNNTKISSNVINKTINNNLNKNIIDKNIKGANNLKHALKINKKNFITYNQNNNNSNNNSIKKTKHYSPKNNIIKNNNDFNTINNTFMIRKKKIPSTKKINKNNNSNKGKINKRKKNVIFNVDLSSDNSKSENISDNSISKDEKVQIKNFEINQSIHQDNSAINSNICSFAPNDFNAKDENEEEVNININNIKPKFKKEKLNMINCDYENLNKNKNYFEQKVNSPKNEINYRNIIAKNIDNNFRKNSPKKENNYICKTEREFQSKELEKIVNNNRINNTNDGKNNYMTIDNFSFKQKNIESNKNNEKEKMRKSITESENSKFNFKINDDMHESEFNDIDFLD